MTKLVHNLDSPGSLSQAAAILPNDDADLPFVTRAVYVGGAGNLAVLLYNNDDAHPVVLTGLAPGQFHRIAARRILATGTTATAIVVAA